MHTFYFIVAVRRNAFEQLEATYLHCASYSFNLAVGDACKIPIIRNSIGTINEIINFFRKSAKRQSKLNEAVNQVTSKI